MKHDTFDKYPADSLDLPQRALLTTWDCLSAYRNELALVGGLAVHHLTQQSLGEVTGAVTLDVDFDISIGATGGMYGSIKETLSAHDFDWNNQRFVREFKEMTLYCRKLTGRLLPQTIQRLTHSVLGAQEPGRFKERAQIEHVSQTGMIITVEMTANKLKSQLSSNQVVTLTNVSNRCNS